MTEVIAPFLAREPSPFQDGRVSPDFPDGGPGGVAQLIACPAPDLDRRCAFYSQTDLGNAERFRDRHGARFRFCRDLGWFVWDGRRWALLREERDREPGEVTLAVMETVRAIQNESDLIEASGLKEDAANDEERAARLDFIVREVGRGSDKHQIRFSDTLRDHAKSSEGAQRIKSVASLAKAFPEIAITSGVMDADPMAVNVLNGTLRVVKYGDRLTVRRFDHNPADMISKLANVFYDPRAECPEYDAFLDAVQPSAAMRRFLHQWGGLSLTGDISEHKLAFFYGKGRNGKTTLVDCWASLAGDYGGTVAIETFLDQGRGRKGGEATPDLARLPGVRFLRTSEPEKRSKLAEGLIKSATGGEPMDARFLNKGFFSFRPSFKLTISGNYQPKIVGTDDGIWARMQLVPWSVRIPDGSIDRALPDKLKKEASGVLNRLIEGMLDWLVNGLVQPEIVTEATRKYRERNDQLGRFLQACTRREPGASSNSSTLFSLFAAWSKATGGDRWSPQGFSKAMEDRGFEKMRSNGMKWLDIVMTVTADEISQDALDTPDPAPRDEGEGARSDDWRELP